MALVGVSGEIYTVGFLTLEHFCLTKMSKGLYSHLIISFGVPVITETLHIAYDFRIFWENIFCNNFRGVFFLSRQVDFISMEFWKVLC